MAPAAAAAATRMCANSEDGVFDFCSTQPFVGVFLFSGRVGGRAGHEGFRHARVWKKSPYFMKKNV